MALPLKWPERFFELHRKRMGELVRQYPDRNHLQMKLRESWDFHFNSQVSYMVNFRVVESQKGTHIVPLSQLDVDTAQQWCDRYLVVGEDEFIDY